MVYGIYPARHRDCVCVSYWTEHPDASRDEATGNFADILAGLIEPGLIARVRAGEIDEAEGGEFVEIHLRAAMARLAM